MKHTDSAQNLDELWRDLSHIPGLADREHAIGQFSRFTHLLLSASTQRGLLSGSQRNEDSIREHIYDSLQVLRLVTPDDLPQQLLDVGSGNGLPGIVLAIALPSVEVRLLERRQGKVEFLEFAVGKLGLSNTATIEGNFGPIVLAAETFDSLTVRAVSPDVVFKALGKLDDDSRRPCCFAYATDESSGRWLDAARQAGYTVSKRFDLKLADKTLIRSYLKFTRE